MEINKIIQQIQYEERVFNLHSIAKQGNIIINPLEGFMPEGISKKACIHIAGDEEVGKTSLGLEFAYRNPDKIVIYIDTYFKLQPENVPDNMYIFRSNKVEEIMEYLKKLRNRTADLIIIDAISNLLLPEEQHHSMASAYIAQRFNAFNTSLIKIITRCCTINACLILLNTINGSGVPSNYSTQIKYQCSLDLLLTEKRKDGDNYWVTLVADKCKTYDLGKNRSRTILLTGQGDDIDVV